LDKGIKVSLASDGVAADLFKKEFPDVMLYELPGYKVSYPSRNVYVNVLRSAFFIWRAILQEGRWLQRLQKQIHFDAIISDNRYGVRLNGIPSILITHQLQLYGSWAWANRIGEFFIRQWIRRFDEVWVPDWSGPESLTGGMAEWAYLQPPVYYIGPLSRFQPVSGEGRKKYDIIAVISGPEPQRSHFEEAIRRQIASIPGNHLLIRGTREPAPEQWIHPSNTLILDLLPADDLQDLIAQSRMLIGRSGYSTVMDLVYSGIPALMVATPGQFEQEFLTIHLRDKGRWVFQQQDSLDLALAWQDLPTCSTQEQPKVDGGEAKRAIQSFMERISHLYY
jgi:hypothetical protein